MSRKFWLFIVALLALMLVLEYQMPRRFQWQPTFAHADRQPFGCYVFDSVLAAAMPRGYTVCRKSLPQLALEKSSPRSIIILQASYLGQDVNIDTLLALAARGNRILYAHSFFADELCDTLNIHCNPRTFFDANNFLKSISPAITRDSIFWVGDAALYKPSVTCVYPQFINSSFIDTITAVPLAKIHNWEDMEFAEEHVSSDSSYMKADSVVVKVADVVALSYPVGRGELILVTTPLLLTNYGVLNYPAYVHRLMNRLKDLPVVRTEAYMPNYNVAETSPFRELLKRPPLRWALYLVLLGIVLLMGFGARRRQRAIPVEAPPHNYQLDFIRHIGTLQYLKSHKSHNPHNPHNAHNPHNPQ